MKLLTVATLILFFAVSALSQQMTDLEKLVATERAFARAASETTTKEAFLKFLADDGIVFEPGPVNGKEVWSKRPPSVGLLSWKPVWADINSEGTLGYTTGPWEFRPKGKDGEPVAFGEYVTIWKKQSDGNFKAILDIGISHGKPEGSAPELAFPEDVGKGSLKGVKLIAGPVQRKEMFEGEDKPASQFAGDVRLYRDGAAVFIGKENATDQSAREIKAGKRVFQNGVKCDSVGELRFCYGVIEVVSSGKTVEKGNFLRIWKNREVLNKRIVLDLYTKIPE